MFIDELYYLLHQSLLTNKIDHSWMIVHFSQIVQNDIKYLIWFDLKI